MTEEAKDQLRVVKRECYKFAQMINQQRIQLIYHKNSKINDDGKLDFMSIYHCYSS